jgi:uncharacterized membrane protein YedE/YeeE
MGEAMHPLGLSSSAEEHPINLAPALAACATFVAGALFLSSRIGWRQAALFGVGAAAGVVLYHAAFGFTSSWRAFVTQRRGAALRAQLLMLALTCVVFFPLLAAGSFFGQPLRGAVAPAGVAVVVGAFLFGVGMQLGGGCASGTLYSAGGGSVRMLLTLASFIAGAVVALRHQAWWASLPALKPTSLVAALGPVQGLLLSLGVLGAIAGATLLVERRAPGADAPPARSVAARIARGPWTLAAGAAGLAAVNVATLLLAGRPWGVVGAFPLWGSKALAAVGVPVASWPYWSASPARLAELRGPIAADVTSVMDIGIMIGAFGAAALAGRFAPAWRVPARSMAAAVIGGLMLGYGARIAYGCNIGALFSGIASGSLHGWLWFAAALGGTAAGTRLRPLFGLGEAVR